MSGEVPPQDHEEIDGRQVVEEYEHLKALIMADESHTRRDGRAITVRDSLIIPEGGDVLDKVRGGPVLWDNDYVGQPCTRVDNNPLTYDRISVERSLRVDGQQRGTASIIFSETTELLPLGKRRLVIQKVERYSQETPEGAVTGECFVKVASPSGEVLEHRHYSSQGPTPRQ